jgi:hypothetical protein
MNDQIALTGGPQFADHGSRLGIGHMGTHTRRGLPPKGDTGFPWWGLLVSVAMLGSSIYASTRTSAKT